MPSKKTDDLASLRARAKAANTRANKNVPLPCPMISVAIYKALVELAEKHGVSVNEVTRWVVEEGLKAWDVRVKGQPTSRKFPGLHDDSPRTGAQSTTGRIKDARYARAAGNTTINDEDDDEATKLAALERYVTHALETGALGKLPTDALLPGTGPLKQAPEEEQLED